MPIVLTGPGIRYFDLLQEGIEDGLKQSQIVRMGGLPEIRVMDDEQALVFEGHLHRALDLIDRDIVLLRSAGSVAIEEKTGRNFRIKAAI
jgi:hypothetical protein